MKRIDQLLVDKGHCASRAQAQRTIKEGRVSVDGSSITKASTKVSNESIITVVFDESDQYVSRGALKLKGASETAQLDFTNLCAIDVGQSTGGFTDYLLQNGAQFVLGIEVGHDQLADVLKQDPRVVCLEGYNARNLEANLIDHSPTRHFDLAVMDVSFISQKLILPSLCALLDEGSRLITLVKPQFELGPEHIGKGGIVKSTNLYSALQQEFIMLIGKLGMRVEHYMESPIKGGDGNIEFLLIAIKDPQPH
jgi:23S rRNA (cytidine1920-2'-O)/16S rRNA (cytidine1409-2'-O)-methyltransferase